MPDYTSIGIHTDHTGLTKFESDNSEGYQKVLGELTRWVKALNNDANQEHVRPDPYGITKLCESDCSFSCLL